MNIFVHLAEGALNVLVAGLLLGAGLPALFALGIRALSYGAVDGQKDSDHQPHLGMRVVAFACFGVVLAAVAMGIGVIVASGFGLEVQMGWPVFVKA